MAQSTLSTRLINHPPPTVDAWGRRALCFPFAHTLILYTMRNFLAILAFGLFSLTSVAQADYQMCGTAHGVELCLTLDTSTHTANVVYCPVGATDASQCGISVGTFNATGSGLSTVITFTGSNGVTNRFYHQGYDYYKFTTNEGQSWVLYLDKL